MPRTALCKRRIDRVFQIWFLNLEIFCCPEGDKMLQLLIADFVFVQVIICVFFKLFFEIFFPFIADMRFDLYLFVVQFVSIHF